MESKEARLRAAVVQYVEEWKVPQMLRRNPGLTKNLRERGIVWTLEGAVAPIARRFRVTQAEVGAVFGEVLADAQSKRKRKRK